NREILDAMVLALLERETLDKAEIEEIFAELKLQSPRPAWTGSARRAPDTRGPIPFPPASSNGHSSSSAIEPALNESRDPDAQ
ncbi:MAG: cell division protein FtsH, partial [Actinomycetota bacterium]|nr:cell division protein FtsH [Actinomycetota bacterium]